eukprot:3142883-Rhodomonas_salina.2
MAANLTLLVDNGAVTDSKTVKNTLKPEFDEVTCAIGLRARSAIHGTDIAYGPADCGDVRRANRHRQARGTADSAVLCRRLCATATDSDVLHTV